VPVGGAAPEDPSDQDYDATTMDPLAPIHTERLRLDLIRTETFEYLLAGQVAAAETVQGCALSEAFLASVDDHFLQIQLDRITARPDGRGWCGRVMHRSDDGTVIGHCGFHGPPVDVGRAEVGYTVLSPFRRRGYASEALAGLVAFARAMGETEVVASISPDNVASLAVVARLGFERTGTQIDDIDGEEWVFGLTL
jgi:RimJ/RimL family protein N-acetyltransferase